MTTFQEDAVELSLGQFVESSRAQAFFGILATELEAIRTALQAIPASRSLATAEGASLDSLGRPYDIGRPAVDDTEYRRLLQACARAASSFGSAADVAAVAAALDNGAFPDDLEVTYPYPMATVVAMRVPSSVYGVLAARINRRVPTAGVQPQTHYFVDGDEPFRWDEDPSTEYGGWLEVGGSEGGTMDEAQ